MSGQTRHTTRAMVIFLALAALAISCKKESDDKKDAGAATGFPLLQQMKANVFSLAYSFDSKKNTTAESHHLNATNKKALIYFEAHTSKKDTLNFLKVAQDALNGTHDVFGGRVRFSGATAARLITDYHCSGTELLPSGSSLDAIFAQMKQCSTTPDLGLADQGVADATPVDLSPPDLTAGDASASDASTSDVAASDSGATDAGGDASTDGTKYDLQLKEDVKNRLYIRDITSLMTLSRIFRKAPTGMKPDTVALLNVYERVAFQNSCDLQKPLEYLLLYADDAGKLLYSRVVDYYTKSGTYGIEEGTVTLVGSEITLDPIFAGECKSELKLNPSKHPVFPVNLWLSSTNCTKQSASQEVFYFAKTDRKCSSSPVTELALKGISSRSYITRKGTAFPATTAGTSTHKFWSVFRSN